MTMTKFYFLEEKYTKLRKASVYPITNSKCKELMASQISDNVNERFRCTGNSPDEQNICQVESFISIKLLLNKIGI